MTEIAGAFVLGFLGSVHCVGMCGAFVMGIGGVATRSGRRASLLTSYFAGKTLTYALLGLVAGGLGGALSAAVGNFQSLVSIALGVVLVLVGVSLLGFGRWTMPGARFYAGLSRAMGGMMRRRGRLNLGLLGMLNGLLPCGLVYAALVLAAASGSAIGGALAMTAFGLATAPALAAVGWSAGWIERTRLRRILPQLGAVLVIIMGILSVVRATPLQQLLPWHGEHGASHQVDPHTGHPHGH